MHDIKSLEIPDVKLIRPKVFPDHRGYFFEAYNAVNLGGMGVVVSFIQDNQSFSKEAGTIRGMHFQIPPFAQAKLVRVLRGAILDVAVDLRQGSPTYGKWCSAEISADHHNQIFIPSGFAHGFRTLTAKTEVLYKVDSPYSKDHERGFIWNDRTVGINWGEETAQTILSEKDAILPPFKELPTFFEYQSKVFEGV